MSSNHNADGLTRSALHMPNVSDLTDAELQQLETEVVCELNLRRQRQHLKQFAAGFSSLVDNAFRQSGHALLGSFIDLVNNLRVLESEAAGESTSCELGSVKLSVPGLADGVTVSRASDSFLVDEGTSLRERNEVRIKVGGLDAYSGYWLALDSPSVNHKDALQEEGIDTLQRLIAAANIPVTDGLVVDALQYPFIAALLSPFGPNAIRPFEEHLSLQHAFYNVKAGGSWFRVPQDNSRRKSVDKRPEFLNLNARPRAELSTFEEAGLEIEKLDL